MEILQLTIFKIGDQSVTYLSLIIFVVVLILALIVAKLVKRFLLKRVFPRSEINPGIAKSFARIIQYFILALGVLIALNTAGINVSILFAGSAAILVGIGFGLQNVANNFISGIIILFERPIKEGDFIEVDGLLGTVISIAARSTKIKTPSEIMIIVPNSFFIEKKVINRSYIEKTLIDVPVTVSYHEEFEKVKEILFRLGNENEFVLKEPEPSVSFSELGEYGVKVKLWIWIKDQDKHAAIRAQINYRILQEFRNAGIHIPYPQSVVRLQKNN